ncbi:DUF418 domain-containing protein [Tautonia sociabilis]|uniref:DUF418 domain-containing protein n=1 Tax=Tautonia sociabilis TaxID=2080755 RepID=A0A432MDK9_9BACT|nr:DUF418 domain-containing protein [Tautonia sociabilis]RUL82811.1 DUF418 domain-containing protein [Tautonia sociabilis]
MADGDDVRAAAPDRMSLVPPEGRIVSLDALRGFAPLGILIANMPAFGQPWAAADAGLDLFPGRYDRAADWLIQSLVVGKFNAIFSFLFGVGFALQMERADARGGGLAVYYRRIASLFLVGIAHYVLLWNGDILHSYAILGLALPLVRWSRLLDAVLVVIACLLLTGELTHRYAALMLELPSSMGDVDPASRSAAQARLFEQGSYGEQVSYRWRELIRTHLGESAYWWSLCNYGGTMLLGYVAGRRGLFRDAGRHAATFRRLAVGGLLLGFACGVVFATGIRSIDRTVVTPWRVLVGLTFILNRLSLVAAYVGGIVLLCRGDRGRRCLRPLAAVGRMPLTNYILQTVACTTILYSYGLGLHGRLGPLTATSLALVIYAVQVALSVLWMARYRFGPLEWAWRAVSYGRFPGLASGG